ncbi:universal stress protein family protein [Anaerobacterium chartisolvens]|uniref:Universal stress protein family protein n=1 Tax=Anaerobacterium chartisolvens TaxID=1297424 RepID=A0A369B526_9FIRM|nr:universal stress protein [Anaerobacterium chartisolvens]RCX16620.1 universal stress protein family protein [Anaerobacterium chartisolvens]
MAHNILVCVTQQKTCERLIRRAAEMNVEMEGELFVLHVAKNGWNFLDNAKEGEALEYLFGISKSVGANLTVLKSDNIIESIINFIKENAISYIIIGESPNDHKENNFAQELESLLQNVHIRVISNSRR